MTRLRFALVSVAILVSGSACGGKSQPGSAQPFDREKLTPEEFNQRAFRSAYEAVESLRPIWLTLHGPGGTEQVQVYVDENHMGGVEVLRTIRLLNVSLIRHLDGIQASARYGMNHDQGAILITTRAAGR